MLSFFAGAFAVAGAAAAAGPVIIHLLNRRRYRVVHWAAMDFLREALQRNRRILHLRDLILLVLRTACVLLFGLAMARPYLSHSQTAASPDQPVHAVLLVDNSLSMGYERLDGTLLDEARTRMVEFLERLPAGSRISVIPLAGSTTAFSRDPFRTVPDARDALQRIEVVDRTATVAVAADLALEACRQVPELPTKRVVYVGDQQRINWPTGAGSQLAQLPELQVVHIAPETPENAWVSELKLQDGVADVETPTLLIATVRYEGPLPRMNVPVTLLVDQTEVASQTIDLEPGQAREVRFTHRFDLPIEPGQVGFVPVSVRLPSDRLKADDQRFLAVPVVAALPVVFVDQYGERESPAQNRYGETFHLRRLLAPVAQRGDFSRQLVQIRHLTMPQLDRQVLQDARLVVIAGVERPDPAVPLLAEYVRQGGQLVIAAGGDFDPAAWTRAAWLDGAGILPLPLETQPVGRLPDDTSARLEPFFLAPETMVHDYFHVDQASREEMDDLYRLPLFFKAIAARTTDDVLQNLLQADTNRITETRETLAELAVRQQAFAEKQARGTLTADEQTLLAADEQRRQEFAPHWLQWEAPQSEQEQTAPAGQRAQQWQPRVLAAFSNKVPFLVERQLGRGQVLWVSTAVHSPWNNLTKTNAVLLFDQILRMKLSRTLPQRNYSTAASISYPVNADDRRAEFRLLRPTGNQESLSLGALGAEQFGVTLRDVTQRGHYRLSALRASSSETAAGEDRLWDVMLAVNGPDQESELQPIDESALQERVGAVPYRWVPRGQPISLEGAQSSGHDLWKWLMGLVLVLLVAEFAVLAWPALARERAA